MQSLAEVWYYQIEYRIPLSFAVNSCILNLQ